MQYMPLALVIVAAFLVQACSAIQPVNQSMANN